MVIPRGYSLFPNLTVISAPAAAQTFDQHILASVVRRLNTVLLIKFNCLLPLNDCLLTFAIVLEIHVTFTKTRQQDTINIVYEVV